MPPRQRAAPGLDDSRSEASSGTRDRQGGAARGRRTANAAPSGNTLAARDPRALSGATNLHAAEGADPVDQNQDVRSQISWSSMPLSVLHDYRHVYNLPCPSAYSSQINSILLSQDVGLRSPTAIAARLAQAAAKPTAQNTATNTATTTTATTTTRSSEIATHNPPTPAPARDSLPQTSHSNQQQQQQQQPPSSSLRADHTPLHRIRGQGRVGKDQLASAVRKHFNNIAVSEQDAVARFLYKVREQRRGREFRLRFQP